MVARAWVPLAAILVVAVASGADDAMLPRVHLELPNGFRETTSSDDGREWASTLNDPSAPVRIVVLDRSRESWDDAGGALHRLHHVLEGNCPHTRLELVTRRVPANADAAVRGILFCPAHEASGRGLVVIDDVIAAGDHFIIIKIAFDYEPFSPGVKPLSRQQRAAAVAVLDSMTLDAPPAAPPP